jgi:hypothetical protein
MSDVMWRHGAHNLYELLVRGATFDWGVLWGVHDPVFVITFSYSYDLFVWSVKFEWHGVWTGPIMMREVVSRSFPCHSIYSVFHSGPRETQLRLCRCDGVYGDVWSVKIRSRLEEFIQHFPLLPFPPSEEMWRLSSHRPLVEFSSVWVGGVCVCVFVCVCVSHNIHNSFSREYLTRVCVCVSVISLSCASSLSFSLSLSGGWVVVVSYLVCNKLGGDACLRHASILCDELSVFRFHHDLCLSVCEPLMRWGLEYT